MNRFLFICLLAAAVTLWAQERKIIIREEYGIASPIGTLIHRFKPTEKVGLAIGKETSENTTWFGRIDYCNFSEPNYGEMDYSRKYQPYRTEYLLTYPLKNIMMKLEIVGLSAEIQYKVLSGKVGSVHVSGGFGLYRWKYNRGAYRDSLTADIPIGDTSATTKKDVVDVFALTANSQQDWSGGFYAGIGGSFDMLDPLVFTLSVQYKNVLGELWPALKIGMENVSGLQMAEFRAGINLRIPQVVNRK